MKVTCTFYNPFNNDMRGIEKEFEIKRKPFFKLKLFFLEKLALMLLIRVN